MFLARVFISPKPTVNDPQGQTILSALQDMGFDLVETVRFGKYLEIGLNEEREEDASRRVEEMCDKLLANPVIEQYRFELERIG